MGGSVPGGNSSSRGVNGHKRYVPDAPSRGTPRKSQAKFRDDTVSGLYKGPVGTGPAGSVFGENSLIEKPGVQDERGCHVTNRSSDTRVAYQGQRSGTGPSSSCGYCCPLCPTGCRYPGEFRFVEPQ